VAIPGDREHEIDFQARFEAAIAKNLEFQSWALVSDAGTPIVNDPGRALLDFCRAQGIPVEALPGPSAPMLAWQWSGGFGLPFVFAGFAPKIKKSDSPDFEKFIAPQKFCRSFCFFDTRHQVLGTLGFLIERGLAKSRLFVAREMSKSHEELLTGSVLELRDRLEERIHGAQGTGEMTLLLEGNGEVPLPGPSMQDLLEFRQAPTKLAAKLAAKWSGVTVDAIYRELLARKK